jgi:hypothetical protein
VVVAGAVVGGYAWGRGSAPAPPATTTFLATTHPLPAGHQLVAADLHTITLQGGLAQPAGGSPFLTPAGEGSALRSRLRTALPAGVILSGGDLTTSPIPGPAQTLVGLDLKPSETPTGAALVAGDRVGILFVPAATQPPYPPPQNLTAAPVWGVTPGASGSIDVTVLVPTRLAAGLAADAQRDEIAVVRLSRTGTWPPSTTVPAGRTRPTTKAPTRRATPTTKAAASTHHPTPTTKAPTR